MNAVALQRLLRGPVPGVALRAARRVPGGVAPHQTHAPRRLLTRMMSGQGPITSELMSRMRSKIRTALEAELVEVSDLSGDGRHVEIIVVADAFDGKSAVNRQRMVYKVRLQWWRGRTA